MVFDGLHEFLQVPMYLGMSYFDSMSVWYQGNGFMGGHPELAMLLSCIVKEPCLRGPSDIQVQSFAQTTWSLEL